MKFTIEGFSQRELVSIGLDSVDAILLRWFVEESGNENLERGNFNKKIFYKVDYQRVIDDLPIIGIQNRESLARRFLRLVSFGILEKFVCRKYGTEVYFRIILNRYQELFAK